jgi:hypothetical protein
VSRNSLFYFITFGCLSLLVSGCGGDAPKPSNSASPGPAASGAAPTPVASGLPLATASPGLTQQPLVAKTIDGKPVGAQPSFSGDIAAGLIPASDTEAATKAVAKGRIDPFSSVIAQPVALRANGIPVSPSHVVIGTPRSIPAVNTPIGVSAGSNLGAASVAGMLGQKSTGGKPVRVAIVPKNITPKTVVPKTSGSKSKNPVSPTGNTPPTAPLVPVETALLTPPAVAPAPEAQLARAIQVSGVSEINGQIQVVVKLPGESFSRYISVGEKVLNGQVLIKRVQERGGITPVVVLEEAGIEVLRRVGEKPLVAAKDAAEPAK